MKTQTVFLFLLLFSILQIQLYSQSNPYKFDVRFKDGHSEIVKSRIYYDPKSKENYIIGKNNFIIHPAATDSIFGLGKKGKKIEGFAFTSTWLFKVVKGEISCYSFVPEDADHVIENNIKNVFFQKMPDLTLKKYSKNEFPNLLVDKPEAIKYYNRHQKATSILYTTFLTGLVGGFTVLTLSETESVKNIAAVCATVIPIASFIPLMTVWKYKVRSIKKYNSIPD